MNNVLELVKMTFPFYEVKRSDVRDLETMPLKSNCGDDCRAAVETGIPLVASILTAHDGDRLGKERATPVVDAIVKLCLLYICG
jgi:hypothetical protein